MKGTAHPRCRLARRLSALALIGLLLPTVAAAEARGESGGGWLGVALVEVPRDGGVAIRIVDVLDASPAAVAGLREGDVIREAGGEEVSEFDDLTLYLRKRNPGDPFHLAIVRDGATLEVRGTLGEKRPSYVFSPRDLPRLRDDPSELHDEALRRSVTALRRAVALAGRQPSLERARTEAVLALLAKSDRLRQDVLLAPIVGFEVDEISPELRVHFGAPEDAGLLISRVVGDSPAATAGLRVGDLMIRTDSRPLRGLRELVLRMADWPDGHPFPVEVVREGKPLELTISVDGRLLPPLMQAALPSLEPARVGGVEANVRETLQRRIRGLEERIAEMEAMLEALRAADSADPRR